MRPLQITIADILNAWERFGSRQEEQIFAPLTAQQMVRIFGSLSAATDHFDRWWRCYMTLAIR
jgi:hypothetical protein